MQTFLPVADFTESARLLDNPRLGKQRVECLQVLRALELPDYGWANHPVVTMWRGRTAGLVVYSLAMVRVWRERGFADTTETLIAEFAPDAASMTQEEAAAAGLLPSWIGDEEVHLSHRSNLLAKDPEFYRPRFPGDPDDLPYVWPGSDDVPPVTGTRGGRRVGRAAARAQRAGRLPGRGGHRAWAPSRASTSTPRGSPRTSCGCCPRSCRDAVRPRTSASCRPSSTRWRPATAWGCPSSTVPDCCWARWSGTTSSRAGNCCRTADRPAGNGWCRGRPRCPPATLQDPRALFRVVLDPARGLALAPPGSGTFCSRTRPGPRACRRRRG